MMEGHAHLWIVLAEGPRPDSKFREDFKLTLEDAD